MARNYRSSWTEKDVMPANPAVIAGQWVQIGEYTIEAGVGYAMGYGFSVSQADADGRLYVKLMDNQGVAVEVRGLFRIAAYTPDDQPLGGALFEARTEALNSSATDRTKQLPFPYIPVMLLKDYKYKFFLKADVSATLDRADCLMLLDITKMSKAG